MKVTNREFIPKVKKIILEDVRLGKIIEVADTRHFRIQRSVQDADDPPPQNNV